MAKDQTTDRNDRRHRFSASGSSPHAAKNLRTAAARALGAWLFSLGCLTASAQITTVINVPPEPAPTAISSGVQLNLSGGGTLDDHFTILAGAEANMLGGVAGADMVNRGALNVSGATIGDRLRSLAGSRVNLIDGVVGDDVYVGGGTFDVSGGAVGNSLDAYAGSVINISGGMIGRSLQAHGGSQVNIRGGMVDHGFSARSGSEVNQSAGFIESLFADDGSEIHLSGGTVGWLETSLESAVTLSGNNFRLDGVSISGLESTGATLTLDLPYRMTLSGILEDGSPFINEVAGRVTLSASNTPATQPAIITASSTEVPRGIREGQTLSVDGGSSVPDYFKAGWGSTILVTGGEIGHSLQAVGAQITVFDGTIREGFRAAYSTVNLFGGSLVGHDETDLGSVTSESSVFNVDGGRAGYFQARRGSTVNLREGHIEWLDAGNSVVNATGGTIALLDFGSSTSAQHRGGVLNIDGGVIGSVTADDRTTVNIAGGSLGRLQALGSPIAITGGEFRYNGVPLASGASVPTSEDPLGGILSGTLADGTPFALGVFDGDLINLRDNVSLEWATLPNAAPAVFNASTDPLPLGIRQNQKVIVDSLGIVPDHFNAGWGSEVCVSGGTIGDNFEAVGSHVQVTAGSIGDNFSTIGDGLVEVSGGQIGEGFAAHYGAHVTISGGAVGDGFRAWHESTVTMTGGQLGDSVYFGPDSMLQLYGGAFAIDGLEVASLSPGQSQLVSLRDVLLSGVLADGSPFEFFLGSTAASDDYFRDEARVLLIGQLPGDFDRDMDVDGRDFLAWQRSAATNPNAAADLQLWQQYAGSSVTGVGIEAVPEPTALVLLVVSLPLAMTLFSVRKNESNSNLVRRFNSRHGRLTLRMSGMLVSVATIPSAYSATLFETAALGTTGEPNTYSVVSNYQFLGARFRVDSTYQTSAIGGHFWAANAVSNNQFFGALVSLSDEFDFPDSDDLSTPDVLGATLLTFPSPLSGEVSAPLTVTLTPGYYAVVFGSGLFGSDGVGAAPTNNRPVGSPSHFSLNPSGDWVDNYSLPHRFFVHGTLASPNAYDFTRVADTTTTIPQGVGSFEQFSAPYVDNGLLAFYGSRGQRFLGDTIHNGVYSYSQSAGLGRVADSTAYSRIGGPTPVDGATSSVGFHDGGLYVSHFSPTPIVSVGDQQPDTGGEQFQGFGDFRIRGLNATFIGYGSSTSGIYGTAGGLHVVADSNTVASDGGTFADFYRVAQGANGEIAFLAVASGPEGRTLGIYSTTGGLHRIVSDQDQAPGEETFNYFYDFYALSFDGTNVAFAASTNAGGIYADIGGTLHVVADSSTLAPDADGATFDSFFGADSVAIDSGRVAFVGSWHDGSDDVTGIYLYENGAIEKVIDSNDALDGSQPTSFEISSQALSGTDLAFLARLADGRQGVYLAASLSLSLPGDFNDDGQVNGADFMAWQRGAASNPNAEADLAKWQKGFGDSNQGGAARIVPEPAACNLAMLGLIFTAPAILKSLVTRMSRFLLAQRHGLRIRSTLAMFRRPFAVPRCTVGIALAWLLVPVLLSQKSAAGYIVYKWSGFVAQNPNFGDDPWQLGGSETPFDISVFVNEFAPDRSPSSVDHAAFQPAVVVLSIEGKQLRPAAGQFIFPSMTFSDDTSPGSDEVALLFAAEYLDVVVDFSSYLRLPNWTFDLASPKELLPIFDTQYTTEATTGTVASQPYGLTTYSDTPVYFQATERPGDFNGDGVVDGGDFLTWQRSIGPGGGNSDANFDGNVDGNDLVVWKEFLGQGNQQNQFGVPEPSTLACASLVLLLLAMVRRTS